MQWAVFVFGSLNRQHVAASYLPSEYRTKSGEVYYLQDLRGINLYVLSSYGIDAAAACIVLSYMLEPFQPAEKVKE